MISRCFQMDGKSWNMISLWYQAQYDFITIPNPIWYHYDTKPNIVSYRYRADIIQENRLMCILISCWSTLPAQGESRCCQFSKSAKNNPVLVPLLITRIYGESTQRVKKGDKSRNCAFQNRIFRSCSLNVGFHWLTFKLKSHDDTSLQ